MTLPLLMNMGFAAGEATTPTATGWERSRYRYRYAMRAVLLMFGGV